MTQNGDVDAPIEPTTAEVGAGELVELPRADLGFGFKAGDDTRAVRICFRAASAKLQHFGANENDEVLFTFLEEIGPDVRRWLFKTGIEGVTKNCEHYRENALRQQTELDSLRDDTVDYPTRFE